ncbi:hypothetical protein OROMI_013862 [Orobanche minor]
MFDRVGFRNQRWNTGMKLDRGVEKNEWYFSALFGEADEIDIVLVLFKFLYAL